MLAIPFPAEPGVPGSPYTPMSTTDVFLTPFVNVIISFCHKYLFVFDSVGMADDVTVLSAGAVWVVVDA